MSPESTNNTAPVKTDEPRRAPDDLRNNKQAEEIDLVELLVNIWKQRVFIYKSIGIAFLLGFIIIIASPREFKSEVVLVVESSSNTGMGSILQQFGGLAGLAGISPTQGNEALTPKLYPDIITSTPFLLEMLDVRLTASKYDSTLTVSEHLDRHLRKSTGKIIRENTLGLPEKIMRLFRKRHVADSNINAIVQNNVPLKLTSQQDRLSSELKKRIMAAEGEYSNTLIISAEMQDPRLAAELADSVVKNLTAYIIGYRTQKAKTDLAFIEQNLKNAEKRFKEAQSALATFQDRNVNVISASARTTEQNLQSEYTLAFNVYNTLAQQLEQAKIKVQEKTPVFKVMDPAKVPLSKNKPRTSLVLIAMVFLGGFAGVGFILAKMILNHIKASMQ